jgi:hypothetical protein
MARYSTSIDSVLTMATAEAKRLAVAPLALQHESPLVAQAISEVWAHVKRRLGNHADIKDLDKMISIIASQPHVDNI